MVIIIPRKDLVNQKFGRLTVIEMLWSYKNKKTYCKCKCDCGNIVIKSQSAIISGNSQSCGCLKSESIKNRCRQDITGQKFNKLTILEILWNYKPKRTYCRCLCDCGNEAIIGKTEIVSGHTQSCGCVQVERTSEAQTKDFLGIISDYNNKFIKPSHQDKKGRWFWEVECGQCGKHFIALPAKILSGHTASCGCLKQSKREKYIEKFLIDKSINFKSQYILEDCKDKYYLKYDFAIFDCYDNLQFLCEYDGEQHFRPVDFWGGEQGFIDSKRRDNIKNTYCDKQNINLLRLPYTLTNQEIKEKLINLLSVTTTMYNGNIMHTLCP